MKFFHHTRFFVLFLSLFLLGSATKNDCALAQRKKKKDRKKEEVDLKKTSQDSTLLSDAQIEELFLDGMGYYVMEDYEEALEKLLKANEGSKANSALYYQIADVYLKLNQPEKALSFIEKALALRKDNPHYYLLAAEVYNRKADFYQVIETYQNLLKNIPGSVEYYFDLASAYLQTGKYKEAIIAYNKLEKEFGMNEGITRQKQRIYLQLNDLESAIKEGDRFLEEYPEVVEFGISQARLLLSNDRMKKAATLIEYLESHFPTDGGVNLVAAEYYRKSGNNARFKEELLKAFNARNLSFENKMEVLAGYFQVNTDEASRAFGVELAKIAAELHPDSDRANSMYADFLLNERDFRQARDFYLKACRINPNQYNTWRQIIGIDYQLQEYDSMIVHTDDALEIFPNQVDLYLLKGTGHYVLKEFEMAMEIFEQGKMFATDLQTTNQFNEQLGDVYQQLQMYNESSAAYREVLRNSPNNVHVLNNFSYYLSLRKESLAEAEQMSAKLLELAPNNPSYLDTRGWVLFQNQKFEEALPLLEKAAKLSNSAIIHEHLGDVFFKLGQKEKALSQWKKAKTLNGETSEDLDDKIKTGHLVE